MGKIPICNSLSVLFVKQGSCTPLLTRYVKNYELINILGHGTHGDVYKCIHKPSNRYCVAKVFSPSISYLEAVQEVYKMQTLCNEPNIITLHDVINNATGNSSVPILIYEYISFTYYRKLFPVLTDTDVRFYMKMLLQSIAATHNKGIIHRDIKPSNVLVNVKRRKLKLIDFSMALWQHPDGINYHSRGNNR